MTKQKWQSLLKTLEVDNAMGKRKSLTAKALNAFEKKCEVALPASYRAYCEVFGAGELGKQFKIAVPGYKGKATTYSLEYLDGTMAHSGLEYRHYSKDPDQHERGIFFCIDIVRSYHFFDPLEVTDQNQPEYAVYTLLSDFRLRRTADNFWQFVTEFCLGEKHKKIIRSPKPEQVFMPVSV